MALVVADRVQETTSTTGTSDYVLLGAATGYQSFGAVLANADTTYYAITNDTDWEVGIGTYSTTGPTLARTTILASSNGGSAVSWGVGVKNIFISYAASKASFLDANGDLLVADKIVHTGDTNTAIRFPTADTVSIETGGTERFKVENSTITTTVPIVLPADPTLPLQAATKEYVDTIASAGIHYHAPVRVESPINLNATYNNGTSGVGATLTNAGTQVALVIDGVTVATNDRVLVYQQTNQTQNGIYTVTNTGSGSTNWVLTRSTDTDSYGPSDPDALGAGDAFFVQQGATGAGELYVCNTEGTITFGTTNITFTQIAATAVYTAGSGLALTGTVFSNTAQDQVVTLTQGGATTITGTYPNFTITSTDTTYSAGGGIGLAGTTFSVAAGSGLTQDTDGLSHADTSSQTSVDNTGATFIQDVSLDGFGHVTSLASTTITPSLIGAAPTASPVFTGDVSIEDKIVHTGDTNTAIRFPAADTVTIETDGVERFRVSSTGGRIGIGVTNPAVRLQVAAQSSSTQTIIAATEVDYLANFRSSQLAYFPVDTTGTTFGFSNSNLGALSFLNTTNVVIGTNGATPLAFATTSLERMRITSTGNVGIGTTSISYPLDVASASNATIRLTRTASHNVTLNAISGGSFTIGLDGSGGTTERMRIDSSGNLGLGVTPSAWNSSRRAFQVGQSTALYSFSTSQSILGTNVYMDAGGTDRYLNSAAATQYVQSGGAHSWNVAPSGTAGNAITFTQAMTLDASGKLLLNTTSATTYQANINGTLGIYGGNGLFLQNGFNNAASAIYNDGATGVSQIQFNAGGTERARIDASGNVGIGTSSPATKLDVNGTANATTLSIGGTAITATATELNFVDGVTSNIQAQINALSGGGGGGGFEQTFMLMGG